MSNTIKIERRVESRTYLNYACSFTIFTDEGLLPFELVELLDVSKDGLSFALWKDFGVFEEGEELIVRLYLNTYRSHYNKLYLEMKIKIMNAKDYIDKEGDKMRYGSAIIFDDPEFQYVIKDFISFMESSSKYIKTDKGDYFIPNTVA